MKNDFETYGDLTIIYAYCKGGVVPLFIDTEDLPTVERISTWTMDINGYGSGYFPGESRGRKFYLHRVVMGEFNGAIPDGYVIDHIWHMRWDNRKQNLRTVTHGENLRNTKKPGRGKSFHIAGNKEQDWVNVKL